MLKTIATLVRYGQDYTRVIRSFTTMDNETVTDIKEIISNDNAEWGDGDEIDRCYTPEFSRLKDDLSWLGEKKTDFDPEGICIWEYNDEVELFGYRLHVSLVVVRDPSMEECRTEIKRLRSRVMTLAEEQTRELLCRIGGEKLTKKLDLSQVRDFYEDQLFDLGLTMFDKHGWSETGILEKIEAGDNIQMTFTGNDSDSSDVYTLDDMSTYTMSGIVTLLELVLTDIKEGVVETEEKEGIVTIKDKKEEKA